MLFLLYSADRRKATGHAASDALMWPIIQGIILVAGSLLFWLLQTSSIGELY